MAKQIESQAEDPNEEVVSVVHDIATGERREERVRRVEVWRSLLGLDAGVSEAQVQAAWQARKDESAAETARQSQRSADIQAAAGRLRNVDAGALTAAIAQVKDEPTRAVLTGLAALLADLRMVIRDSRE